MTIGMTEVACINAGTAMPPVTITSTLSRTNSAAISAKRSLRPSAQRYSIAIVRCSTHPSSASRLSKSGSPRTPDRGGCPTTQEAYGRDLLLPPPWSLRARRERPRHRAPNHFDEIASPHIGTPSPGRVLYPLRQELDRGLKTIGAVHSRCLRWVESGKAPNEQIMSALPPKADVDRRILMSTRPSVAVQKSASILAASPKCGLLNQSHTRSISC